MSDSVSQWASVSEAAVSVGVSERTAWRWVHAGLVESKVERRGQRDIRLVNLVSLPPTDSDEERQTEASDTVSQRPTPTDNGVESQRITDARHEPHGPVECACCKVLENDVDFLRAQLDRRAEEAQRQSQAEGELRRLLLCSQQVLQMALDRPMLPPASEVVEKPTRGRWWRRWWG